MKARKKSELDVQRMVDAYILLLDDGTYREYNTKTFDEYYEIVED